jgi:hypothetical protein
MATQVTPFPQVPVGPGMTTSALSGSIGGMMTPQEQQRMWELQDRKDAERRANNAQIIAQRNAEAQARQDQEDRARVRAAFDQTYGPQLQRAYQDTAVQSAASNSAAGRARDWAIGHGFTSGGTVGQPGTDIIGFAAPRLQQPTMKPEHIQNTLDTMWSGQTDPYLRSANQVMGNLMKMFHPSDEPAKEWGRAKGMGESRKSSGGGKTTPVDEPLPTVEEWKKKYPRE